MAARHEMDPHTVVYHCVCGSRLELPATATGRKARCRKCGNIFVVPLTASLTFDPPPVIIEVEADEPASTAVNWSDRSFWSELAGSLVFFRDAGNLATLLMIVLINMFISAPIPGGFALFVIQLVALAWLCAFLLETVLEVASGEDALPTVWLANPLDDLVFPAFRFAGTWLAAMAPAMALACLAAWRGWQIPESATVSVRAAGLMLWPAIMLTTAIGRSWGGLYPHVALRVPLASPFAYLAVCGTVATAWGVYGLPELLATWAPGGGASWKATLGLLLLTSILNAYFDILSMRAIGLYYRHYKRRLPFEAE